MKPTRQNLFQSIISHLNTLSIGEQVLSIFIYEGKCTGPKDKPWYGVYIQYKEKPTKENMESLSRFLSWYYGKDTYMDTEYGDLIESMEGNLSEAKGMSLSEFAI